MSPLVQGNRIGICLLTVPVDTPHSESDMLDELCGTDKKGLRMNEKCVVTTVYDDVVAWFPYVHDDYVKNVP